MAPPIDRCPDCGASYTRFRGGTSVAAAQASIVASIGGIDRDEGKVEDDRCYLGAGHAMALASVYDAIACAIAEREIAASCSVIDTPRQGGW